eukprot:jgi/Mesvir1/11785/Mv24036-RA.1
MACIAIGSVARACCAAEVLSFTSSTCPSLSIERRTNLRRFSRQANLRSLHRSVGANWPAGGISLGRQCKTLSVVAAGGNADVDVDTSSLDFLDQQLGLLSDKEAVSVDGGSKFRQKTALRPVTDSAPLEAATVPGDAPPPVPAPVLLEKLPISFFVYVALALVALTVVTNFLYSLLPQ